LWGFLGNDMVESQVTVITNFSILSHLNSKGFMGMTITPRETSRSIRELKNLRVLQTDAPFTLSFRLSTKRGL
jgi:hypothetical protein